MLLCIKKVLALGAVPGAASVLVESRPRGIALARGAASAPVATGGHGPWVAASPPGAASARHGVVRHRPAATARTLHRGCHHGHPTGVSSAAVAVPPRCTPVAYLPGVGPGRGGLNLPLREGVWERRCIYR